MGKGQKTKLFVILAFGLCCVGIIIAHTGISKHSSIVSSSGGGTSRSNTASSGGSCLEDQYPLDIEKILVNTMDENQMDELEEGVNQIMILMEQLQSLKAQLATMQEKLKLKDGDAHDLKARIEANSQILITLEEMVQAEAENIPDMFLSPSSEVKSSELDKVMADVCAK
eukprot:c7843_g1_i1.p1 GENE.c7843_g1_i1~~c7843_g1_i1.p1  ORF type:complete len:184 (+),score=38.59 c7843_g1_i1:45-554(+)